MQIHLYPPQAIHEKGKRQGNEDNIYPPIDEVEKAASSRLFLVCDGVGGEAKGEEASHLACMAIAGRLKENGLVEEADIEDALRQAERDMDEYTGRVPEAKGMATTLTLLCFHEKGATVAHIGDSRVYQVRAGSILFKTTDHSFVEELIANKVISREAAATHPKRNVVTRAIMGSHYPAEAEVGYITDIEEGDYFFLCTDGVLESITDDALVELLGQDGLSDDEKIGRIRSLCLQHSRDNFSAYLVRVKEVAAEEQAGSLAEHVRENEEAPASETLKGQIERWIQYLRQPLILYSGAILAAALVAAWYYWPRGGEWRDMPGRQEAASAPGAGQVRTDATQQWQGFDLATLQFLEETAAPEVDSTFRGVFGLHKDTTWKHQNTYNTESLDMLSTASDTTGDGSRIGPAPPVQQPDSTANVTQGGM